MLRFVELLWKLLLLLAHRRVVDGYEVRVVRSASDRDEVFEKVRDALLLLEKHGPRFRARLSRDVNRIFVTDMWGGSYVAGLKTCCISIDFVRSASALDLAMTIVHEATHARLSRLGFSYNKECRERLERLCVGAEIAFAGRVPGSEANIRKAQALLEKEWWTPDNYADATVAELRERGVPAWLTSIVRRVGARRKVG